MKRMSMELCLFVYCGAFGEDIKQIRANIVNSVEAGKKSRQQLRANVKGSIDKGNEEEGETYQSVAF